VIATMCAILSPMKAIEGKSGRIFVLRLEHDDPLPKCIEDFAAEKQIQLAQVVFIGGIYSGNLVAGPRITDQPQPDPIVLPVHEASEAVATGIIAHAENGKPVLHMHGALGRAGQTMTGCFQKGVSVWLVGEAVIYEILSGSKAKRVVDKTAKLTLLEILE
jgi:predicted DNA-binding protein with PD1-like motif